MINAEVFVIFIPAPDWLRLWFYGALVFEIYPEIKAIAVELSDEREMAVRYYLDREPTDFDCDSLKTVVNLVISNTSSAAQIKNVLVEECCFSEKSMYEMALLEDLIYARREYDIPDSADSSVSSY